DAVMCEDELLAPILALTRCRVPFSYFAYAAVARTDVIRREAAVKQFWKDWRLRNVQGDFVGEVGVRYVFVRNKSEGLPATIPDIFSKVFENSEFAVFKVHWHD